jgi:hypothetical protein
MSLFALAGNQTAVSIIQATHHNTSSKCILSGTSRNNVTVLTGCQDSPGIPEGLDNASIAAVEGQASSWNAAPACSALPTKQTAVSDTMNRLWGYEKNNR